MRALKMCSSFSSLFFFMCLLLVFVVNSVNGSLVNKEERRQILSTEYGNISAIDISFDDGFEIYHLQFISLVPNSIFLPVLLHTDMLLYVHTGNGTLSHKDGDETEETRLRKGDVHRVKSGSVFYIQSSPQPEFEQLQIYAIFSDPNEELMQQTWVGPYSGIRELFQGFESRLLQAAFQAPEEVIEEIINATKNEQIIQAQDSAKKTESSEKENVFVKTLMEISGFNKDVMGRNKKKHKHKDDDESSKSAFNLFEAKRDVENCNGWSTMVTPNDYLHSSKGLSAGVFMVNLSTGAMAGPHWNPSATEITIVLKGRGMVRVVCSSKLTRPECNNERFLVKKGDIFAIPRSQLMAHMSFNDESLVFMGFTVPSGTRISRPKFLAGKDSFLRVLNKRVLELAFNVNSTTISKLLGSKTESIQECVSCAEEEEKTMEDEEMGREEEEEEEEEGGWEREERKRGWEALLRKDVKPTS